MEEEFLSLVNGRRGHFLYESGHHGELWFDLETLCSRPAELHPQIARLAAKLAPYCPQVVCSPLVEGAFIGLMVAAELKCQFSYAARVPNDSSSALFSVGYHLPVALHPLVKDKRVIIVNDVTNAGSAVRGTLHDLRKLGAHVLAVGSLVVLGDAFGKFAAEEGLPLESLAQFPNQLWQPKQCPLCAKGLPIEKLANA